ncbi:MAG: FMN-binding protein [Dermatophilaceae bacterium]
MSTLSALVLLFSYPTSTNAKTKAAVQTLDQESSSSGSTASSTGESTDAGSSGDSTTSAGPGSADDSTASGDSPTQDSTTQDSTPSDTATTGSGSSGTGGTFTGDSVMTRWGLVQVAITVKDGRITKSEVVQVPWDNPRDQQINSYAVPILNQEVVTAQSSQIDMVSGATVTSDGYISSLQSAIDQAHLS